MLKTKTAPAPAVKVEETKTLSISTRDIRDRIENKIIRNSEIENLTDNDREFLKEISHSYKETNYAYKNEIGFNIALVDFDVDRMVAMCLIYSANIELAKFINNVLFENICDSNAKWDKSKIKSDKPIYTDLHIFTYDNDID